MLIDQTHPKVSNIPPYLFRNGVKPNFTRSSSEELQSQALGFTRSLVAVAYLEKIVFFSNFRVSVASVQPNLRDCDKNVTENL
ncbi:MAG: hypothetical protein OXI63_11535 [Candidatus Poribacteria bacterium]|nr:hypothetical protein [Candidatus Poribacteria bacterium]